jgi:hypothetical protein
MTPTSPKPAKRSIFTPPLRLDDNEALLELLCFFHDLKKKGAAEDLAIILSDCGHTGAEFASAFGELSKRGWIEFKGKRFSRAVVTPVGLREIASCSNRPAPAKPRTSRHSR